MQWTTALQSRKVAGIATDGPSAPSWLAATGRILCSIVTKRWTLNTQDLLRLPAMVMQRPLSRAQRTMVRSTQRARRKALVAFPVPAEMKWHQNLQFQSMFLQSCLEEMDAGWGRQAADEMMTRSLYLAGKRWMRTSGPFKTNVEPNVGALAEVLNMSFRSLDIVSKVVVEGKTVTITNSSCPLLRWAHEHNMEAERVCQSMCGNARSFFKGVSYSYPTYVTYRATHMMGKGHPVCKKSFAVR
ncbi:MAG: hypothetical protein HYX97_05550 [Chloroflexi bacterium]|nr:hypothetical protein [Chloroflexota bacterium]